LGWDALGNLALRWDGHQESDTDEYILKALRRHSCPNPKTCFYQLFSLGILVREKPLGPVRFCSEIVKAYFATSWVQKLIECNKIGEAKKLLNQVTQTFRSRIIYLLEPLVNREVHELFCYMEVNYEPSKK
jgi:hypothetical protein